MFSAQRRPDHPEVMGRSNALRFALTPAQKQVPCLVANAGKLLTTGSQAACYADYQIGMDLTAIAQGKTYFQVHSAAYLLQLEERAALKADPNAPTTAALVAQTNQMNQTANTLQVGESSRGLLLTAYGFSVISQRTAEAATACFGLAGLLLLAGAGAYAASRRRRTSDPNSVATA